MKAWIGSPDEFETTILADLHYSFAWVVCGVVFVVLGIAGWLIGGPGT